MQHSAQILDQKINHTIHKNPIFLSILIQNSKEQPDFLSDQTGKKPKCTYYPNPISTTHSMKKNPQIFCIKNPKFQTHKRKLRSKNE
jgi:hypothetical protein